MAWGYVGVAVAAVVLAAVKGCDWGNPLPSVDWSNPSPKPSPVATHTPSPTATPRPTATPTPEPTVYWVVVTLRIDPGDGRQILNPNPEELVHIVAGVRSRPPWGKIAKDTRQSYWIEWQPVMAESRARAQGEAQSLMRQARNEWNILRQQSR